jgi:thiosulfate/3-mercaptopyruvate sulfurtransferase
MADILHKLGIRSDDTLIFTCGSGITACVVAFAALMCGFDIGNIKIYDASWCEWGNGDFDVVTS